MIDKIKTFDVSGEGLYKHEIGNKDCSEGWCDCFDYPKKCDCGGLIHADFGDNEWEDTLHLADIIDKHLYRYLEENCE